MITVTMWGGYSYAHGEPETFESWAEARFEYLRRRDGRDSTTGLRTPLWGDCELDAYVIYDEFDNALTLADVLRDHDDCDEFDSCGVLHA
jgi:hypothetical protein